MNIIYPNPESRVSGWAGTHPNNTSDEDRSVQGNIQQAEANIQDQQAKDPKSQKNT